MTLRAKGAGPRRRRGAAWAERKSGRRRRGARAMRERPLRLRAAARQPHTPGRHRRATATCRDGRPRARPAESRSGTSTAISSRGVPSATWRATQPAVASSSSSTPACSSRSTEPSGPWLLGRSWPGKNGRPGARRGAMPASRARFRPPAAPRPSGARPRPPHRGVPPSCRDNVCALVAPPTLRSFPAEWHAEIAPRRRRGRRLQRRAPGPGTARPPGGARARRRPRHIRAGSSTSAGPTGRARARWRLHPAVAPTCRRLRGLPDGARLLQGRR